MLIIFDVPISFKMMDRAKSEGFELHSGTFLTDQYILFWQNNDGEQIEA